MPVVAMKVLIINDHFALIYSMYTSINLLHLNLCLEAFVTPQFFGHVN